MKASARFLCLAAALAITVRADAGSIWARANTGTLRPRTYEDDVARRVGDVLTIIINERSVIDHETKRDMEKKSDRSIKASGTVNLEEIPHWWGGRSTSGLKLPTIDASSQASTKFEGEADYESERTVTDRITVTVHDVLPNGNLVVLGSRRRNVDGDVHLVCVSGVVRPSDITFANTVSSEQVADFHMVTVVKGPENRFTHPGWLGRILNLLSPW